MLLPGGKPLTIEFLDSTTALQPHVMPFIQNLGRLGIQANLRIVDAAQLKSRTEAFDFDVVGEALPGQSTPGVDLRIIYTSAAAAQNGSRNLAGIADPAVDAMVETIATAKSRAELNTACRALDRILRAGHYWVPDVVSRHRMDRLLGRLLAAGSPTETRRRRARHLVVGRREGQIHWTLTGA